MQYLCETEEIMYAIIVEGLAVHILPSFFTWCYYVKHIVPSKMLRWLPGRYMLDSWNDYVIIAFICVLE